MLESPRSRIAEVSLKIGRDAGVQVTILLRFARPMQHFSGTRDGQRGTAPRWPWPKAAAA